MNSNLKILLIHNYYTSSSVSGENIIFEQEVKDLKLLIGESNIYTYSVSNDYVNKLQLLFDIWFSRKHYNNIKKIVEEEKINIVHIHNFFPLLTPSVFKAAKDGGAKVIHTLHNYRLWCISGILYRSNYGICEKCINKRISFNGIFNKCYRKSIFQSAIVQVAFWFYKITKVFDNIDYFFVLTNFQKEKIISFGINKKKIILKPNSLDLLINNQSYRKENYIYVGRLEESKGIYELLRNWVLLDNKFILTIIGTGEIEDSLRKTYQKDNIIFLGKCNRDITLQHIASSKYLIQPSIWYETFGLTIIEAMSFGVPVIGSNLGTRSDFIEEGVNGFLYSKNDFIKVIEKSYCFDKYEELVYNSIKTANQFKKEHILHNQLEIYKNINSSLYKKEEL